MSNYIKVSFLLLLLVFCSSSLAENGSWGVTQKDGRWWLTTPEGELFYSVGLSMCHGPRWEWAQPPADAPDGPEYKAYAEIFEADCKVFYDYFRKWNFNTAAAWGGNFNGRAPRMPVFLCVRHARQKKVPNHPKYDFPNVYDPKFKESVERWAERIVKPNANDPLVIGWFIDNEYLLPQDEKFQEQFYKIVVGAIRNYDKKCLLLGTRHVQGSGTDLDFRMEGKYCDVLSVNCYGLSPEIAEGGYFERMHRASGGKPILLSEFTFAAKDSGLPNVLSWKGTFFENQADRAKAYEIYTNAAASTPYIIGTHFFLRKDRYQGGAMNNWGLIDSDWIPYYEFVSRLSDINAKLHDIHTGKIKPKRYPEDYPDLTFAYNDNPHTKNAVAARDEIDKNWVCQRAFVHYACTAGTGPYFYDRSRDELWGTKKYGFIEYRFDIEKDYDKPILMLRYSRFPGRPTQVLQLQINNEKPISISLPSTTTDDPSIQMSEPDMPEGWDYGFINQKINTITIPLKKPIQKGLVNVRFCVTKPWKDGQGVQLHSFFLTNGSSYKVDEEHFYQLVPLGSSEKTK